MNAMARRLDDGALVDPLGGRADLERATLRTVSPTSFAEDPLRLVRGLRFVSQLGFDPDDGDARADATRKRPAFALVSGERIGGGLAADGMGELSKLLLGAQPAKALAARARHRRARRAPARVRGRRSDSTRRALPRADGRRAHVRGRAGRRRRGRSLAVRLAALFHDVGKPEVAWRGTDGRLHYYAKPGHSERTHEQVGAALAETRSHACATRPSCAAGSSASCARTCSILGRADAAARAPLARPLRRRASLRPARPQGGRPAREGRRPTAVAELEKLARFRQSWSSEQRRARTGSRDLAVERRRPDRARVSARPGDRAACSGSCSTRSSTSPR